MDVLFTILGLIFGYWVTLYFILDVAQVLHCSIFDASTVFLHFILWCFYDFTDRLLYIVFLFHSFCRPV